jgi:hypothetical protein
LAHHDGHHMAKGGMAHHHEHVKAHMKHHDHK